MVFTATMELRWLIERFSDGSGMKKHSLQQKWISNTGEIQWRSIPSFFEGKHIEHPLYIQYQY